MIPETLEAARELGMEDVFYAKRSLVTDGVIVDGGTMQEARIRGRRLEDHSEGYELVAYQYRGKLYIDEFKKNEP